MNHFSLYSIAGTPIAAATTTTNGGGNGGGGGGGGGGGRSGENTSNIEVIENMTCRYQKMLSRPTGSRMKRIP